MIRLLITALTLSFFAMSASAGYKWGTKPKLIPDIVISGPIEYGGNLGGTGRSQKLIDAPIENAYRWPWARKPK